jgi:hypothetical protein
MREGDNPYRWGDKLHAYKMHHVIIPVHIPNESGYYKSSLEVLRLCLESLRATASGLVELTLISNASIEPVLEELQRVQRDFEGAQIVVNAVNRGKVDAALSAARSSYAPLITIADADVLFHSKWLSEVTNVFRMFPEAGFVSPSPNPTLAWRHTASTVVDGYARGWLKLQKVVPDADLDRFANSVGNPHLFDGYRSKQLIMERSGARACVGSGHFVFTIRREVLGGTPTFPVLRTLNAEDEWLDTPADAQGFWRLATTSAFADHMGNVPEPWMEDAVTRLQKDPYTTSDLPLPRKHIAHHLPRPIRRLAAGLIRRRLPIRDEVARKTS